MSTKTQNPTSRKANVQEPDSSTGELLAMPEEAIRLLTRERIEDIAFAPMPSILRQDLISGSYGDLAQAMADLIGQENATWCTLAQWTNTGPSYTNGLNPGVGKSLTLAINEANRTIFADLGWAHVVFLSTVGRAYRHGTDLDRAWQRCLHQLELGSGNRTGGKPGGTENEFWASIRDPRPEVDPRERDQLLVLGFRAYFNALGESDPDRRARSILLANCLLTLLEHRRLSTAISFGLRARLRSLTGPQPSLAARHRRRTRLPAGWRLAIEDKWIHYATRHLINVRLPSGSISVGHEVPPGRDPVPVVGQEIEPIRQGRKPAIATDNDQMLSQLFWQLDVNGQPARCWNDLIDRVTFLAAVLAYHQREPGWFDASGRVVRPEPRSQPDADSLHIDTSSDADADDQLTVRIRAALYSTELWPVDCPAEAETGMPGPRGTIADDSLRRLQAFLAPRRCG